MWQAFNPTAIRMAGSPESFGHSECNRIKEDKSSVKGGLTEHLSPNRAKPHNFLNKIKTANANGKLIHYVSFLLVLGKKNPKNYHFSSHRFWWRLITIILEL